MSAQGSTGTTAARGTVLLFSATAFIGAALLFVVQPLVAKLLLPSYGGSATVWSTSSLFFQLLLLGSYLYVHLSATALGARWQPRLHLPLIFLPALVLPLALPADSAPAADASPALWLLRTLTLMIGLPFAVLATTGPVLQKWFSWSSSERAEDPYFLFAASNLGSFGGLLAYPLLIEPTMSLDQQRVAWSVGFLVFGLLSTACVLVVSRAHPEPGRRAGLPAERIGRRRLLVWTGLAALPASMSLAVTAHISTDVAAIPLLWVVPLAIYLATFVLAFARRSRKPPRRVLAAACAVTLATVVLVPVPNSPVLLSMALSLTMLALVGYAAHARLAADRPPAANLTLYYLVIAAGGALGGVLNGFVAPQLFDRVWEFPLSVVLVPLLLVGVPRRSFDLRRALVTIVLVSVGIMAAGLVLRGDGEFVLLCAVMMLGGWALSRFPVLLVVALIVPFALDEMNNGEVIERSRSFFGSSRVESADGEHRLVHGTTQHGMQFDDPYRRRLGTTYYASPGSVADVFSGFDGRFEEVGAIGLGAGTIATYGAPGQRMTFFEIDADMVRIARDPALFTFLTDSAARIETVVGDGRLMLAKLPPASFDLLVLDAFSSDSIPAHLLTREALRMYADRLRTGGVLAVHISNRVFDLRPVLAGAAEDLDWQATVGRSRGTSPGSLASTWVVLSSDPSVRTTLMGGERWAPLETDRAVHWTDSYSSLLPLLR